MRRFNLFYTVSTFVFCISCSVVFAQDTSNTIGHVSIASPTAASLGKYGDFPVSYNTGIPQIGIPIYTVQSGNLKLPIGVSYHASGLKVQEQASWVGAGWSLNAGGVITRTVIGAPDDRGVNSSNICTNGYYSDFGFNSYEFIPGGGLGSVNGMVFDETSFERGYKDAEPDLYFFNFGGYSGKFYFNDDRTPVLVPEQDFKITPDLSLGPNKLGFQGFVVTTPDGVKYYFGKTGNYSSTVDPVELTTPATLKSGYTASNNAVSSWFLNKVVSADGVDSITLGYNRESYSYFTLAMNPVSNLASLTSPTGANLAGYNIVKNFVVGVALNQVNFANGTVKLLRAATSRTDLSAGYYSGSGMSDLSNDSSFALGSIAIYNSSGFCKKDSFYYGYFNDTNPLTLGAAFSSLTINSDAYRLRLDSVKEYSCDATIKIPAYTFTYFTEMVPRKLSFGADHWGFSNGVTTNQGLIPSYSLVTAVGSVVESIPGANRDAVWPAMRGGSLQQITYPTGGSTNFVFQPNDTYVNFTKYTNTFRKTMSCGYDGHNGSLGDGGDNPDTTSISSTGNTFQFILANTAGGGSGELEIFYAGTHTLAYNIGGATAGQTDTLYTVLAPGSYWMELTKSPATSGNGITATVSENVPYTYSGNDTVGGLRIQSIVNNDGINPGNIVTSYDYTAGGSSGILYSRPVYVQSLRNDDYALVYGPVTGCAGGCFSLCNGGSYYISPSSISPMSTMQGNHIGYNQVKVSQTGNGYSIYQYYGSNKWDYLISDVCTRTISFGSCNSSTIPNFPAPPEPFDYIRGELKYEAHYNNSGQVLKDVYYFPHYVVDPIATPGEKFVNINSGPYSYTDYTLQSASKTKDSKISTTYDPVNANHITTKNIVYYGSANHHQPTRSVTFTSTSDSLVTTAKYAMDFRITSCDAIPDSLPFYNALVDSLTDSLYRRLNHCPPTGWMCQFDTLQWFRRSTDLARIQYIKYRRRSYAPDTLNLQSSCYLTALSSADTLLKPVLRLQNFYKNPTIETSDWKNLNLLHASFMRYDTSFTPLSFAYPGRTKLINLQAPSSSFTVAAVSGSTIAKDSRYIDESIYSFTRGNPQQVIPHDGVTNSYVWDYLNTEPIAKVTNAAQADIAYTSFEADGKGNWTYAGTPVSDASSPTGAKCYNLTSGALSRSGLNSATTYIVSYWSKTGGSYGVTGGISAVQGKTINGWTYIEQKATGVTTISITGTGNIDEVRLYPATAQMTTYTYTPLLGITSACDGNNKITYYFYDNLGRLKWIKDQDLNILKTIQYHYQTISGIYY